MRQGAERRRIVLEGAGAVDEVTGVDTHLFDGAGRCVGCLGVEVYVGHQRGVVSPGMKLFLGLDNADTLLYTARGVEGRGVGHRLYAYRVRPSERRVAYLYDTAFPATIVVIIHDKRERRE